MNPHYKLILEGFTNWLMTLNYSDSAVTNYPKAVKELLYYLEQNKVTEVRQIMAGHIQSFASHIKKRKNKTTGAGISSNYINSILQATGLFIKYLKVTGKHIIHVELAREPNNTAERTILTRQEIADLYSVCDVSKPIGLRDRAMLAVFYGCGLRKNEGTSLDTGDILISRSLLHVRKGKNYKERNVPVTKQNMEDLINYLYHGRDWFLHDHYSATYYRKPRKKANTDNKAFFLSMKGRRMTDFTCRIRVLKGLTNNIELQEKQLSLHTLRHSIATHLLQSGMDIEYIAQFLGHSNLESTQVYTHLVNEL